MPQETKHQKFMRVANRRLTNAVQAIGLLPNLANPKHYENTEEEAVELVRLLDTRVNAVAKAFGVTSRPALPQSQAAAPAAAEAAQEAKPAFVPQEALEAAISFLVYNQPDKALETLREIVLEQA